MPPTSDRPAPAADDRDAALRVDLRTGGIAFQSAPVPSVCFVRHLGDQRVLVIAHSGPEPFSAALNGQLLLLHNGRQEGDNLVLNQWGGAIILEKECER